MFPEQIIIVEIKLQLSAMFLFGTQLWSGWKMRNALEVEGESVDREKTNNRKVKVSSVSQLGRDSIK